MNKTRLPTAQPTPRQMRYLRDLAVQRGESFAYPSTFAEADREIKRLRGKKRTSSADRRREVNTVRREMSERRGDAASVRADEVVGYGSNATWR